VVAGVFLDEANRFCVAGGVFAAQFVPDSRRRGGTLGEIDAAAQTTPLRGHLIAGVDVR
jgi:hypothetical protein